MSYTKREWATGNVVGAVDLNRIENGIADIDVDEIRGWSVSNTQLFSETVTTSATEYGNLGTLAYTGTDVPESMSITYDGITYSCTRERLGDGVFSYGDMNLSDYPFRLVFDVSMWHIMTQTAGSHTISASLSEAEVSSNFNEAVNACIFPQIVVAKPNVTTWQAIYDAVSAGKIVCIVKNESNDLYMRYVIAVEENGYQVVTCGYFGGDLTLLFYVADSANSPIYPN